MSARCLNVDVARIPGLIDEHAQDNESLFAQPPGLWGIPRRWLIQIFNRRYELGYEPIIARSWLRCIFYGQSDRTIRRRRRDLYEQLRNSVLRNPHWNDRDRRGTPFVAFLWLVNEVYGERPLQSARSQRARPRKTVERSKVHEHDHRADDHFSSSIRPTQIGSPSRKPEPSGCIMPRQVLRCKCERFSLIVALLHTRGRLRRTCAPDCYANAPDRRPCCCKFRTF